MPSKNNKNKWAKRYSPKLKFHVVLEVVKAKKDLGRIARAYGVHPTSIHHWKNQFMEKGPEVFSYKNIVSQYEAEIAKLERLIGQKEVENALLKNFLGREG